MNSLRKAAILISALDTQTADRLLDQMDEQQAARVRSAVMHLDDVSPQEQETILAEFFGQGPASGAVEVEFSAESERRSEAGERERKGEGERGSDREQAGRFLFLNEADCRQLASRLRHEHPQLVALVVAHLTAEKAAELLQHLPPALQDEVLDRASVLDDAHPEVIAELERELEQMFAGSAHSRNSKRQDHRQAILKHLRPIQMPAPQLATSRVRTLEVAPVRHRQPSPPAIPTLAFEQLLSLSADDFFALLNEADPRLVMLALAGASRRLFERYVSQFSQERAIEFERHLEQLRPLRLRDVETAQQELAEIAGRLLIAAKPAAESSRRFAAAA